MKWNRNKRARFLRWNEGEGDGADGANGGGTGDGGGQDNGGASGGDGGSLLDGVAGGEGKGGEGEGAAQGGEAGTIPEKYRVLKEDGSLDEAASTKKLADAYRSLEQKLGKGASVAPPASPDDYKLEAPKGADGKPVEGIDIEAFVADPLFKEFAKGAHEQGMTNAQLQFAVEQYLQLAPQLVAADQELSLAEAKAELSKLWTDDGAMGRNLSAAAKAMRGFGGEAEDMPGSHARLVAKYGRDPDFMAFAARVGAEMKEDRQPGAHVGTAAGAGEIEALQKSEAYWNANHPDHARVTGQVREFYARQYGDKRR